MLQLERREQELSRRVVPSDGLSARADPWTELAAVRDALPRDSVLIEIVRFDLFNFQAETNQPRWQPARYVAWIIPPSGQGEVQIVDLGDAVEIEKSIAAVRGNLQAVADTTSTAVNR